MEQSLPSPSETCSDWSSGLSDCGPSSSSSSTVCTTTSTGLLDFYRMSDPDFGRQTRRHQQHRIPVALVPSSTTTTSSSTQAVPSRSPPDTPDRELKAQSLLNSTSRRRYATEGDWRRHKDKISSLYRTKRLKDVIAVMEGQYQFFATERMYKARFKEWGLQKNVTATEVHKLMQKVEEEQQRRRSPSASGGRAGDERVVLDVGEDLDVRRIQKYMKRKPVGLGKLRPASKRSLEVIKALSVDNGKGGAGRGKVSIPKVKLEQQDQQRTHKSPPQSLTLQWPQCAELPGEIVGLLQAFIDNRFDCPYPFTPTPTLTFAPLSPSSWQPQVHNDPNLVDPCTPPFEEVSRQDEAMLDFVLKFRFAHILLDDGLAGEGMQTLNASLDSLAFYVQQAQNASPFDTRPATWVSLWALSAALEMTSDFKHIRKLAVHLLFQRMMAVFTGYQPTLAEMLRQMSVLGVRGLVAMLKLTRHSISRALLSGAEYQRAFGTYSRTVDIAESSLSPGDKLQSLQMLANDPIVHDTPALGAWMETRIALSVPGASSPKAPSPWHAQGQTLMVDVLGLMTGRIEWHKAAGNWQVAHQLESRCASVAQTVWGGYSDNATPTSAEDIEILRSTEQMASSLAPLEPSMLHMALPEVTFKMSHLMSEASGWEQEQGQGQQRVQVPSHCESLSMPVWSALDTSRWQVDDSFASGCGMYDDGPY
ncbi:hypothetical protein Daus18300_009845 [Diaporthe australafricana]|uniref:Clr5 domain-containing protein n=1 Tax=Diaporthe australafricana TaxID=127596 RepID=A0ABR3WCV5_9PEZI